ncbi:MAG: general secretion pathway protein GspK [candidate division NC10 bacterium]|nr:general secretion pathway protein GspK [candidate division NC10 bacterium]MDE2320893.1 general secretion pathway protein GspK [candidate division NC10 bacterium]
MNRCVVRDERGLALAVVLWILAFLGVVFTAFTFSMRTELAAAGNFKEEAESYYLAEAGVYRAAAEIMNADRNVPPDSTLYDALDEHWHTNPAAYENVALGGGHYWVTVTDEESRFPLNGQITPQYDAMLRRLFSSSGVTDDKLVSTIVDSIQDWRDADNLHRLNGAEDDYYLSLPTPYRAKNADFDSVEELLLVKGMTPEILYGNITNRQRQAELGAQLPWERDLKPGEYLGVARHLSVYSSGQVNVNTASPEVLMTLGLTAAEVKAVLDRRTQLPFKNPTEFTSLITSISGGSRQGFAMVPGGQPGPANPQQIFALLSQTATVSSKNFAVDSAARITGSRLTVRVAAILRNDGMPGRPKLSIKQWSLDPRQAAS